jgi:hypothetical protein
VRAFGNLGFDLMLLVIASTLVLALGLYPAPTRQPDDVVPVTRLTTPKARTYTNTAKVRQEPVRTENGRASRGDKTPEQNRYDSLRKAWGG